MGGRGAQRPVWGGNELKKTGARTRGQNPLVNDIVYLLHILESVCSKFFVFSSRFFTMTAIQLTAHNMDSSVMMSYFQINANLEISAPPRAH